MITLGMMQFTAVVLMSLLTAKLLLLRGRRVQSTTARQARWLMICGTALLALHFLLQLSTGLRKMGVTQAVELNLAMLIPASFIFAMAILLLQRRGKLNLWDKLVGLLAWVAVMVMMGVAAVTDGQPLVSDSPELRQAELAGAVLYMLMQGYYTWRHTASLIAMRRMLNNYYDRDTDGMLRWMQLSIVGLMLLALMVPLAIFGSGPWLLVIAFAIYFFIFYLVDCFCFYLTSPAPARMQEAERYADEMEKEAPHLSQHAGKSSVGATLSPEVLSEVEQAVATWQAGGGHLRSGLLQPIAAAAIGVPKYQLMNWLHSKGMKYSEWIAALRIDEAKRIIEEHPEWSNDAVAEHCGFADRTVLQRTFKRVTGMTPTQFAAMCTKRT